MIYATAGEPFEAILENAETGLAGTIGVTIIDPPSTTIIARTTAGIAESTLLTGVYTVTLTVPTAPVTGTTYLIVWDHVLGASGTAIEDLVVLAPGASPLPAPTADPRDLTTLEAVKRLLQTPSGSTGQDDLLQEMITEASVMLQRELGRTFIAETGTTHTFRHAGNGWVSLAPYDLRALTAVTFDADGTTPQTVTSGDWRLRSRTDDSTYLGVALTGLACRRDRGELVELTGDWGMASVPADVERGVKITVKTWLREGATFTPDGDVVRFERVGRIPQDVLDGLSHYRPVLVG